MNKTSYRVTRSLVLSAVAAKDFAAASSQSIKVAETCTTCHGLYRPLP